MPFVIKRLFRRTSRLGLNAHGLSIVEMMIAAAILSICVLGLFGAIDGVKYTVQFSKAKGLASNQAQEKIQVLEQQSYYKVLVTTDPVYDSGFSPSVGYDTGYYPPETIREGGVTMERRTLIQVAQDVNGSLQTLAPTSADTGMKLITVSVIYTQRNERKVLQLRSVFSNPDTIMANATIAGNVKNNTTSANLANATINVAENVGWRDVSDASGNYGMTLNPGNYTLLGSAPGYFPSLVTVSVGANATVTQNFRLVPMSSGTVRGTAWVNDHLVLASVVGSTVVAGFSQEYVEIFNPTTYTWTASDVGLYFQRRPAHDPVKINIDIDYVTPTIAPNGFYIMANTGTITAGGVTRPADAVWDATPGGNNDIQFFYFDPATPNVIPVTTDGGQEGGGSLELYHIPSNRTLDILGWTGGGSGQVPAFYETSPVSQMQGLQEQEQFVRHASTAGASWSYGPAYDSGDNTQDWSILSNLSMSPRSSALTMPVVAGVPAIGAIVSSIDGLSSAATAVSVGSPPVASFALTSVATGMWTIFVTSGAYTQEVEGVNITPSTTVWIPHAATTPSWTSGMNAVKLAMDNDEGIISGRVTNVANNPISPTITVSAGSGSGPANTTNGNYTIRLASGVYTVTANEGNTVGNYVSQSSAGVTVNLGQVASNINFVLSQGGQARVFISRGGNNPLPGVAVTAFDPNGVARAQGISGADGRVLMINLATGAYTVEPIIGSGETASPLTLSPTVTAGSTIHAGTFTISGAMGSIRGSVKYNSNPIATGVLLIASTSTISSPPALSTATLSSTPYYIGTSLEDGTYALDVRGSTSTTYRVYAYFIQKNGSTITMSTGTVSNISVLPGQPTTGVNFTW